MGLSSLKLLLLLTIALVSGCGSASNGSTQDTESVESIDGDASVKDRDFPEIPLIDKEERQLIYSNRRIPLLKEAAFNPTPTGSELIADYFIRSRILPEEPKQTQQLWRLLRRSRKPLEASLKEFVNASFADISSEARDQRVIEFRPIAEKLLMLREFIMIFEGLVITPEFYVEYIKNNKYVKNSSDVVADFKKLYVQYVKEGKSPSEATLRAAVAEQGKRDRAQGVPSHTIHDRETDDFYKTWRWLESGILGYDSVLRTRFLKENRGPETPSRWDEIVKRENFPDKWKSKFYLLRSNTLVEITAALVKAGDRKIDLTLGQPFSKGERSRMDGLGRIAEFTSAPPTSEEIRLALLREFATGDGEMISPTTVSRRIWFPHPKVNAVFRGYDARMLYHVKQVKNVSGSDAENASRPVEVDGGWECSFDVRMGISMSQKMLGMYEGLSNDNPLYKLSAELMNNSGQNIVAERWTGTFRLTSTGWRCPSLGVQLNKQNRKLQQLEQLQDAIIKGL